MCPEAKFWLTFAVSAFAALATFLAAAVALFGRSLMILWFPPVLRMKLLKDNGELTLAVRAINENLSEDEKVRIFHLRVWNARRIQVAHNVRVFLTAIEERGPDDQWYPLWEGNVQMRWKDQEVTPLAQEIGSPCDCDLFMVHKDRKLISLMTLITPNNLKSIWTGESRFIMRLQARSTEKDSAEIRLKISWDGLWEDGELEMMTKHLKIEVL